MISVLKNIQSKLFCKKKTALRLISFFVFAVVIFNATVYTATPIPTIDAQNIQENKTPLLATKISLVPTAHAGGWFTSMLGSTLDTFAKGMLWVIDWILYVIIYLEGFILKAALAIFNLVLNEDFLKGAISGSSGTYLAWAAIRDFMNLFFMMVLLFSAFATVFQVDKYHLKKFVIMLVVMALLTNFSYPIALFIIDFSNSAMMFIADIAFGNTKDPSTQFATLTNLGDVFSKLMDGNANIDRTVTLLLGVIIMFMFSATVLAYAINLYVRTIALTLLVIFSSVGFTLSFFPATQSISNQWWSNLIKYCMMGPVLLITLLLTLVIFNSSTLSLSTKNAVSGGQGLTDFIVSTVNFALPLITLWMGLAASQKFGAVASASAMKAIKGTGGMLAHKADRIMANTTGFSVAGTKEAWKNYQSRLDKKAFTPSARKMENILEATMEGAEHLATSAFPIGGVPVIGLNRLYKGAKGYDAQIEQDRAGVAKKHDDRIERLDKNAPDYQNKLDQLKRIKDDELAKFDANKGTAKKVWAGTRAGLKNALLSPTNKARRDRNYLEGAKRAEEASKKIDEEGAGDSSYSMGKLKSALDAKDSEAAHAAILSLTRSGDLDTLMQSDLAKNLGLGDGSVNDDNLGELLKGIYAKAGITNEAIVGKNMQRVSEISSKNDGLGSNLAGYDSKKKAIAPKTRQERIDAATSDFRKKEPQQRQRVLRSSNLFKYSNDTDAIFSEKGLATLEAIDGADLMHVDKLNGDIKKRLSQIVETYDTRQGIAHTTNDLARMTPEQKKIAERENKLIEQYKEIKKKNAVAEKYIRMAHHMQLGKNLRSAQLSAERDLGQSTATTATRPAPQAAATATSTLTPTPGGGYGSSGGAYPTAGGSYQSP